MNALDRLSAYFVAGGPVMLPLLAVSIWMWSLILIKFIWLWRIRRHPLQISASSAYLNGKAWDEKHALSLRARALDYFLRHRGGNPETDRIMWQVAVTRQIPPLTRHLSTIKVLGATAPLLGLLGTVNGMVTTFGVLGLQGAGNAQALASGIKEALITTQTGLLIAIPGLLAGQALHKRVRDAQGDLMIFFQLIDQWIERRQRHA